MTDGPKPADRTTRDAIAAHLRRDGHSVAALSGLVSATERDVVDHLEHIERSVQGRNERFEIDPSACLACGFVFEGRTRLKRPGKCPSCKGTRISYPSFRIRTD